MMDSNINIQSLLITCETSPLIIKEEQAQHKRYKALHRENLKGSDNLEDL
jgi:hypothetical protein